jgi:hypothetical protein
MKLTGKCKDDFEKWFRPNVPLVDINIFNHITTPFSMQYGVYVDFFESVGIYTSIEPLYDMQGTNRLCIYSLLLESNYYVQCKNRQEAREKAIEKANEIYNKINL